MKRTVFLSGIAVLFFALLYMARKSLAPLFIGISFAYILTPAVKRLEKSGVKRHFALICVYLIVLVLIFATFWIGIPYLIYGLMSLQKTIADYFGSISFDFPKSIDSLLSQFGSQIFGYIGNAATTLFSTISVVLNITLGLVLSFYMISDREKILSVIEGLVPKKYRTFYKNIILSVNNVLRQFLTGQLGVALVMAALLFVGLIILKIKYALLLAFLAGLLEFIPYFGAFLGAAPAIVIALSHSPQKAIWTAALFVVVQQLEGAYISPKILGDHVGVHPIITIMAVIVGGHLFGFAGMLLAVPACGIIRSVANEIIDLLDGSCENAD